MRIEARYVRPGDLVEMKPSRSCETVRDVIVDLYEPRIRFYWQSLFGPGRWFYSHEKLKVIGMTECELTMRMLAA